MPVVPYVTYLTLDNAIGVLANADLVFAGVLGEPSDEVARDAVVRAEPVAGTDLPAQSRVSLVVSTGHSPSGVVPDLAGLDARYAEGALVYEGYVPGAVDQASPDVETGIVIRTTPPAGTRLDPGAMVTLHVSSGWVPDPDPPVKEPVIDPGW
jgi:serine/threonine-protein kinase